jgi:hypothetical protein
LSIFLLFVVDSKISQFATSIWYRIIKILLCVLYIKSTRQLTQRNGYLFLLVADRMFAYVSLRWGGIRAFINYEEKYDKEVLVVM